MGYHGRYSKGKPKKRKGTLWIVLGALLGIVLVAGIGGVIYVNSMLNLVRRPVEESKDPDPSDIAWMLGNFDETDPTEASTEAVAETTQPIETAPPDYSKTGKIINIMIVGQDSRKGEESKLSDTMILCTINREKSTMTLTSFLRDTYIKLPDMWGKHCGKQRMNVAYNLGFHWKGELGAMQMLDQLILEQFGVTVDYNVEIDFEAFVTIIDHLGGVDVELNEDEANYMNQIETLPGNYQVGGNHLDGWAALNYVRMRHATPADSDINRAGRQRSVIGSILEKCRSMTVPQMHDLLTELLPMVLTDMPNDVILTYAAELLPIVPDLTVESMQVPAEGTYHGEIVEIYDIPSGVLVPDVKANREMLMAVAEADTVEME